MGSKKISKFPKGFFQKERKTISMQEALKDVIPIDLGKQKDKDNYKRDKSR